MISESKNLLPYQGEVYYIEEFLSEDIQNHYLHFLKNYIAWEHDKVFIYGKEIVTKRKVAWFADNYISYAYSGSIKWALPFNPILNNLKNLIEVYTQKKFNACLLNYYHDGNEYMGWHSDDEKSILHRGTIASVSLGVSRRFLFKHKINLQKVELILNPGSLLIMQGETQHFWKHSLPKSTKITTERINLTFRQMLTTNLSS